MYITKIDHMNLSQIANSGQCFRWHQINENTYRIPAFGKSLDISQNGERFTLSCDEDEWKHIWELYFDVGTDYKEAEQIIMESGDEFLKEAYSFGEGLRILRQELWEVLISFIISQNNNIPRIKKSIEKICGESGGNFPGRHELLEMNLSDKGLGYREKYIRCAAEWYEGCFNGTVPIQQMSFEKAKELLMDIKGVGNKVADCICLFGLHHLEAFPIDTHIKKILNREYDGRLPEWTASKYAGLFQQYIFYYELK